MKKVYKLENLDCANCAAEMVEEIKKIKGISSADISFMAQKLTVETTDESDLTDKIEAAIKKVDDDCELVR